ncbi:MAG: YetF domain-containing protein [Terracidiphilus sp.]
MLHSLIFDHMFALPLPILEKLLRPVIVYLVLVLLLRLFGKRELAQLNPFDLVVLLSLSNTVQNAIIGDDNSVTGGVIGAFSLLAINWLVVRVLFRSRRLTRALEGRAAVLVHNGQIDMKALTRESLTREELLAVIHRQGFENLHQVRRCELEPNGTFYVEAFDPSTADKHHAELLERLDALSREVAALRLLPALNLVGQSAEPEQ